jgi:hypothetical protein
MDGIDGIQDLLAVAAGAVVVDLEEDAEVEGSGRDGGALAFVDGFGGVLEPEEAAGELVFVLDPDAVLDPPKPNLPIPRPSIAGDIIVATFRAVS